MKKPELNALLKTLRAGSISMITDGDHKVVVIGANGSEASCTLIPKTFKRLTTRGRGLSLPNSSAPLLF